MTGPKTEIKPCGTTNTGEQAWCSKHLSEQFGVPLQTVRTSGEFQPGSVACGSRVRGRVIGLGTILAHDWDEDVR